MARIMLHRPSKPVLVALFLTGVAAMTAAGGQDQPPTFYKDVLPLLQQHCQACHRPGEPGPMPLLDYAGTKPWAGAIVQAITSRQMPPWFADPSIGHFRNDRSLSETEIRTITAWVDAGAPAGDPKDAPKPVDWVEGWAIGQPERVFTMPASFNVPTSGVLPYQYVIVPTHFQHDTWVHLAEVRAGDRAHTHHIVVSVREPGSKWLAGEPIGIPFALNPHDAGGGVPGEFLAGYGPGALPELLGPGQAKLIRAGSDLVFQLHYTTNGQPGCDRSRIGLVLSHEPPRARVLMLAAANIHFLIPPGDPDYEVNAKITLQANATLVSLLPHMHLRGKSFEFRAVFPDGRTQTLLRVPHYSYNWQLSYYLAKPLALPAGTTIECTAHFDNSAANPLNPDPTRAVRFGPQSWDEMMIGYFEVATDLKFDLRTLLLPGQMSSAAHTM
jgi:mono/diheme cytochrome c family protein